MGSLVTLVVVYDALDEISPNTPSKSHPKRSPGPANPLSTFLCT